MASRAGVGGALFWNGIWSIPNKTYVGLFAFVPYVGFIMALILGFKGREWAWRNRKWESVDHFNETQRKWSYWGVLVFLIFTLLGIFSAIAIPAYNDYQHAVEASPTR